MADHIRSKSRAAQLLRLVVLLRSRRRGIRQADLIEEFDVSRQTIHGYLVDLESAGVPLGRSKRNGEVWLTLEGDWLTAPSDAEVFALVVAGQVLRSLPTSAAARWLEPRLRQLTSPARVVIEPTIPAGAAAAAIERSIIDGRRLRLTYRSLKDDVARDRVVEPIELRLSRRSWYLFGIDADRRETRTYKLSRVERAVVLTDVCVFAEVFDPDAEHAHAVDVWTSDDTYDVAVRIHPPQARVAHEYPLTRQAMITPDGDAVIVRARVTGLEEVTRWVLRWGGDAEVIEPPTLIARLRDEVERMQRWL